MLIVSIDVCQQLYGWMPSLEMRLSLRIRSKVKWVQNENFAIEFITPKQLLIQIILNNSQLSMPEIIAKQAKHICTLKVCHFLRSKVI